ncbi:sulfurtransferase-like selenium metabolism protein YedF [Geobacter pickeringii]|uniref:SirA family protein n=1 Tax=Geobacter pickeringii TaxID=345632 RepID=A0A0B5BLK0_9BACT|nr:sulfurtransferase-like selenium metabolism protein YedF [Geobacter pickeringii]AJE04931.1 SirA family protein [Geobacter pickeringii]
MKTIDCRNMACPLPVVTVKRALESAGGETVRVLLDDGPSRENVRRFVVERGYAVEESSLSEGVAFVIGGVSRDEASADGSAGGRKVVLITSDRLGEGPEELGRLLMKNFIITLLDLDVVPDRMLFVNGGIFLTTEGSEVLEALEKLGNRGVEVLSCGVCLDFYHRKDKLRAGAVTNMFTIADSLLGDRPVLKL